MVDIILTTGKVIRITVAFVQGGVGLKLGTFM